jgi:hypothetical protein
MGVCRRRRHPAWPAAGTAKVNAFEQQRELGSFHRLRTELAIFRPASVETPFLEPLATGPVSRPKANADCSVRCANSSCSFAIRPTSQTRGGSVKVCPFADSMLATSAVSSFTCGVTHRRPAYA